MSDQHDYQHDLDACACGRTGILHLPWEPSTRPVQAIDRVMMACNFTEPTKTARCGTKAYVISVSGGNPTQLVVRYRSRGGRWITKWENRRRLGNFRRKTIPPGHPMHEHAYTEAYLENLIERVHP